MHLSGVIASAILIASAQATTVRVVKVGSSNGGLGFSPSNTQAKPGDVVQFQFMPGNYSVAQAAFRAPCMPVEQTQPATTGWWSGFMPMPANARKTPVFSVMVSDSNPTYFYDAQSSNCQNGMVGAINAPTTGSMTVAAFASAAKSAPQNMAPGQTNNVVSTTSSMASTLSTSTTSSVSFAPTTPAPTGNAAGRTLVGAAKQSMIGAGIAGLAAFLFL